MKNLEHTNRELIVTLYHLIQCPTQKEVAAFALKEMPELSKDKYGNLFTIHPNTPMLCAHMDNVWSDADHKKLKSVGFRKNKKWQWDSIVWAWNLWADDKCWVAIALYLKKKLWNKISILLTKDEESWGLGISDFCRNNEVLLNNINYTIIADRRWSSDIICANNEYWTEEFQTAIQEFLKPFGYKPSTWTFSDCDTLSSHMNSANLSCWYYNAHSSTEYIKVNEFENCCNAIEKLVTSYNVKLAKPEKTIYSYAWGMRKGRNRSGNYRDDIYGISKTKTKQLKNTWWTYSKRAKCNIMVDIEWDIYNEDLEWLGWMDPDTWEEIYDWYIEGDDDDEDSDHDIINVTSWWNLEILEDVVLTHKNQTIYLDKWFYLVQFASKAEAETIICNKKYL